ncbi:MAG: c-type cytochrome [Bacteroidetes bacterium]|nr:c-type cytochrome [Bacteroidota bacterium]
MRSTKLRLVFFSILFLVILNGFVSQDAFFAIEQKDVELTIPKGFPKPFYDFKKNKLTPEGFKLGRRLFYDPILSKDNFTSCATCHLRFAAFAHIDHALSHGVGNKIGKRNVPAIQNLIFKDTYMADGGVNHLDLQPIVPLTSEAEMGETLESVIQKLQNDSVYPALFKQAFGDSIITSSNMLKSLSQFVGLMISSDSRYDKFVAGKEKFNENESNGLKLFRARCTSCHKEPLLTDNSYRNNGLVPDEKLNDEGRKLITGLESDKYKFKVPSLRNVAMTYPYMHDGRFNTLEEVVAHYSDAKFYSTGYDKDLLKTTGMTESEKIDLVIFLRTLTDKTFLYDRRFADPFPYVKHD